jgi:hypothetical protein
MRIVVSQYKRGIRMKRTVRFRLRTFLLAIAAVSVGSGFLGKNYIEHRREQQALADLQEKVLALRGKYEVVSSEIGNPAQQLEFR